MTVTAGSLQLTWKARRLDDFVRRYLPGPASVAAGSEYSLADLADRVVEMPEASAMC
jgi:hypothetical protein